MTIDDSGKHEEHEEREEHDEHEKDEGHDGRTGRADDRRICALVPHEHTR